MALQDTLTSLAQNSNATRNRVDILLDDLEGSPDHAVLTAALRNRDISAAVLTKALWKEYGAEIVKENSIAAWRRNNAREVTGL